MSSERELEETFTRYQFAARLRRLADAVEADNVFTIEIAGESIRVPASAIYTIEHERSGDEEELEFQLVWTRR